MEKKPGGGEFEFSYSFEVSHIDKYLKTKVVGDAFKVLTVKIDSLIVSVRGERNSKDGRVQKGLSWWP